MERKCLKGAETNNIQTGEKAEETLYKPKSGSEETLQREKTWVCDIVVLFI